MKWLGPIFWLLLASIWHICDDSAYPGLRADGTAPRNLGVHAILTGVTWFLASRNVKEISTEHQGRRNAAMLLASIPLMPFVLYCVLPMVVLFIPVAVLGALLCGRRRRKRQGPRRL